MPDNPDLGDPLEGLQLKEPESMGDDNDFEPELSDDQPPEPDVAPEAAPDEQPANVAPEVVLFEPIEAPTQDDYETDSEYILRQARHETQVLIKTNNLVDTMIRDVRRECPDLPEAELDKMREEWSKGEYNSLGRSRQARGHIVVAKGALADMRDRGVLKPAVRRQTEERTPVNNARPNTTKSPAQIKGERRMAEALGVDPDEFVKGGS